jgi:hypothetical protein
MLNDHDFAIDCLLVNRLPFVAYAEPTPDGSLVVVKLTSDLAELLPENRCIIYIVRRDFSLDEVVRLFELDHVEYFEKVAALARKLLRESKRQLKR